MVAYNKIIAETERIREAASYKVSLNVRTPQDLMALVIGRNTIAISWTNIEDDDISKLEDGFYVYMQGTDSAPDGYTVVGIVGQGTDNFIKTGLTPGFSYSFYVIPFKSITNNEGDLEDRFGEASNIVSIFLPSDVQPGLPGAGSNAGGGSKPGLEGGGNLTGGQPKTAGLNKTVEILGFIPTKNTRQVINPKQFKVFGMYYPVGWNTNKGYFTKVAGVELVKQNLLQLLGTSRGERVMLPNYGCNLRKYLFQPLDEQTFNAIKNEILFSINKYSKGIEIIKLTVKPLDKLSLEGLQAITVSLTVKLKEIQNSTFALEFDIT